METCKDIIQPRRDHEVENMVISDEEFSGVSADSGDEIKEEQIKKDGASKRQQMDESDSDSDGECADDLPFVINEVITKYGSGSCSLIDSSSL